MTISAAEQMMIELINRARLDPQAEADLFGISLDQGLTAGSITAAAKQPLAPNTILEGTAISHSRWMLDNNTFSHTGADGLGSQQRIGAAGYDLSGDSWRTSENISRKGTTGTPDLDQFAVDQHEALFLSTGHRQTLLDPLFQEIGVAQLGGSFTSERGTFNSSMVTHAFGTTGRDTFLTGVSYTDDDRDLFYTLGEGRAGVTIALDGGTATSAQAGGYSLTHGATGPSVVTVTTPAGPMRVQLDLGHGSAKLDVTGDSAIAASTDIVALDGVVTARLLGGEDLNVTGAPIMIGNAGDNLITGGARGESLRGGAGADTIMGGNGSDTLSGNEGDDFIFGGADAGDLADTIFGNDGDDSIDAGYGNDVVYGQAGDDTIAGGFGVDEIIGGTGDDVITGSAFSDLIFGQAGDDFINGGFGSDRVNGGAGADRFFHLGIEGHGSDWIQDFGSDDILHYGSGAAQTDFQINVTNTATAGADDVDEVFVIFRPTEQILWALVDGAGQSEITLQVNGQPFDLIV